MYSFTTNWFKDSELRQLLSTMVDSEKENRFLEIGSFEGQSTVYLADTYCKQPGSKIVTVDPFDLGDNCTTVTSETEKTFLKNVAASPESSKIVVRRQYSDDFFRENTETFTFIYIDGSHAPMQIQRDAANAFKVLETGGILWFDDYLGGEDRKIKEAIDFWFQVMGGKVRVVHSGYQIGCVKVGW